MRRSRYAAITGLGMAVPERVVTNEELAARLGVDSSWVVQRTGIRSRRVAAHDQWTSTLAAAAGLRALEDADVAPEDLDLVVVGTCTPDQPSPGTSPVVQAQIGASRAGAFDVNAGCAGFLTALSVCTGMIQSGTARRVLVIGAEVLSRFLDRSDPKTAVLFGDGAGAVLLEVSDEVSGLVSTSFGSDGTAASLVGISAGGSRLPASEETVRAGAHHIHMNGPEVFRNAVRVMEMNSRTVLSACGLETQNVDLMICHQANDRIISEVGRRMGLPEERVFSNVARYGNTSSASIPIAMSEAAAAGLLRPGSNLLLSAVGAGLSWVAGMVVWTRSAVEKVGGIQRPDRMEVDA